MPDQVLVGHEVGGPQPNSNVRLLFAETQFAIGFDAIGAGESTVVDALAMGNTVVLKPAEFTSLDWRCASRTVRGDLGLPAGVVNVDHG